MSDTQIHVTPVGRMISNALFEPSTKGYNPGEVTEPTYFVQIAISKTNPELQKLFDLIQNTAKSAFPGGEHTQHTFSWKFKDGDSQEYSSKEGCPGSWLFSFSSRFFNGVVDANNSQVIDKNQLKNGYQIRVGFTTSGNGNQKKPGIYLNVNMVQIVSIDKEINNGPSAATVFSSPAQAMPMQPDAVAQNPMQMTTPNSQLAPDHAFLKGPQVPGQ